MSTFITLSEVVNSDNDKKTRINFDYVLQYVISGDSTRITTMTVSKPFITVFETPEEIDALLSNL